MCAFNATLNGALCSPTTTLTSPPQHVNEMQLVSARARDAVVIPVQ